MVAGVKMLFQDYSNPGVWVHSDVDTRERCRERFKYLVKGNRVAPNLTKAYRHPPYQGLRRPFLGISERPTQADKGPAG